MPNKLTIQDVQKYIDENANGQCTLLSTEYVNTKTPLLFKCNVCGNQFERDFGHLKRGRFLCVECLKKSHSPSNKLSIKDVQKFIDENDIKHECTLLSTEYINS
jgi:late competence protein required for DNA uptake (superfamily II DNA/RNA helicase)